MTKTLLRHLLLPWRQPNTPHPVLNSMSAHRHRHQDVVLVNLKSPHKNRGVPTPGHNNRARDVNCCNLSAMTVTSRE